MKAFVAGVKVVEGIKNGRPWEIPMLFTLLPVEQFKNDKVTVSGYGFEFPPPEKLLDIDPACLKQFEKVEFPCMLDLDTDVIVERGGYKTVVTGIRNTAKPLKAA